MTIGFQGYASPSAELKVEVVDGDITQEPADALITAVNSGGMWFGGVDGAIMRVSTQYHDGLADVLRHGRSRDVVTVVKREKHEKYAGKFSTVVFVIDDLDEPLSVIVRRGLTEASTRGFRTVTMPMIRFGVMARVGGTPTEKMTDITQAIHDQMRDTENRIEHLKIVVYGDVALTAEMAVALGL